MADSGAMLAGQRRAVILEEVRRRGAVRVAELTRQLNVSDMTVRRDLDALARAGEVVKVHGGAVAPEDTRTHEPDFATKSALQSAAKRQIALAAARLVAPGSAIALSGGSTAAALARSLTDVERLTVVTNSVPVADVFESARREGRGADALVVLTGGVRTRSDALVGPVADQAIRSLNFDVLFLGVHGLSAQAGLSSPNLAEAETNRLLVASARRVVVVADHTKWGVVGLSSFAALDEVDTWVTDAGLPDDVGEAARQSVREVLVAATDA
ncbi:DeoR/GlpR family DNA-binding transcription regulator [Yinghuangia seranimata]|uniref:DeoR/GlpR family DNA-binding transcription regulator n=1 Tax=Yinghuangia seranimata TaxID=408067 RepID=UPI00248BBE1B|nr:DeoR/GlpR family DNA-binding transcription regulator [Yinghuangia seranimata]MDI2126492.1 DeoR/GlpR family DNA-binding transcription regulator [Yinghuangia seranimata]